MFLTLDGIDGVGKSTQMQLLADWLRGQGRDMLTCRDPGSTKLGEAVRSIVLGQHDVPVGMRAEMLLYMAARAQLVEEVIRPALEAGRIVISDRFLLANVVYQGYGGGLDVNDLWSVGQVATAALSPDRTYLLDMPPEQAMQRLTGQPDRMERRGLEFLTRVREGFLAEARARRGEIVVVDASRTVDEIQDGIRQHLSELLSKQP